MEEDGARGNGWLARVACQPRKPTTTMTWRLEVWFRSTDRSGVDCEGVGPNRRSSTSTCKTCLDSTSASSFRSLANIKSIFRIPPYVQALVVLPIACQRHPHNAHLYDIYHEKSIKRHASTPTRSVVEGRINHLFNASSKLVRTS